MFKKAMMTAAVAAALGVPGLTPVQQALAAEAEASPHTLTGNVGIYSQYIFRGLRRPTGKPALQGGFDYAHSSGFYVGTWASNVSWLRDAASPPTPEAAAWRWDFYGGYKWRVRRGLRARRRHALLLVPRHHQPDPARPGVTTKADTWEVYAALGLAVALGKYSYA